MLFQVLSIPAPAGSRIRTGRKTIAVCRWQPDNLPLRDLLIVQHKGPLSEETPEDPSGSIVATVNVTTVRPWREEDVPQSTIAEFEEGWFAWELENIRPTAYNQYVPARLGLHEVDLNPKYILYPDGSLGEALKIDEEEKA